jgi:hypothetical protein
LAEITLLSGGDAFIIAVSIALPQVTVHSKIEVEQPFARNYGTAYRGSDRFHTGSGARKGFSDDAQRLGML